MKKRCLFFLSFLVLASCSEKAPQLGKAPVDLVVEAMTLEEKVTLMVGSRMEDVDSSDVTIVGDQAKIVPGAAGSTFGIPRLGIPPIVLADGPAGLRISPTREGSDQTYYCTHFPIGSLLSSSWNEQLVEEVGAAIGNEAHEYGADILLAPALNIHRNPLCGRNFEYYSEDPLLSGKTAAAYVRGVQSQGVGTSVKHFAVNNQETNRKSNNAIVSERALREIYLKGFEIAVKEADPWTVMSSYNKINGISASENKRLLTTILRDEWGFNGSVMTDWFGGDHPAEQVIAGNDMLEPGQRKQYDEIIAAVKDGSLDEAYVDRNVRNILNLILRTPRFKGYAYSDKPDLTAHAAVTRQSALEGMVLLKNDDKTLPLAPGRKIALFGYSSYDFIAGGTGSGNVNRAYTVSLTDGLKGGGFLVDESLGDLYQSLKKDDKATAIMGGATRPTEPLPSGRQLEEMADADDVALITLGRISGEFRDRPASDFQLTVEEKALIDAVCKAFHARGKKVAVILNIGGVIETASWKALPDAILCAWQAGQEGGNSVTDLLSGKQSPSGKLPMTFPVDVMDHGSSANFPLDGTTEVYVGAQRRAAGQNERNVDYTNYEEGIYVGYRWFGKKSIAVSYPFGYGLSYTTFDYGKPEVDFSNGVLTVRMTVTNSGDYAGKEAVQLYVSAPDGGMDKPVRELKAFAKTRELAPGESETLYFKVDAYSLASFNEGTDCWETAAGKYDVLVGASVEDIRGTGSFEVAKSLSWLPSGLEKQ